MVLKHGKHGFDRNFVSQCKLKIPNLRMKYMQMKEKLKKDFNIIMNVDEELKNGRPDTKYADVMGSGDIGNAIAGLKKVTKKRYE